LPFRRADQSAEAAGIGDVWSAPASSRSCIEGTGPNMAANIGAVGAFFVIEAGAAAEIEKAGTRGSP
jgi:hypothetical protein